MSETLSSAKKNPLPLVESYSLNKGFVCDTVVNEGAIVKLKVNGEVTPVTAVTDKVLGVVVVGNKAISGKVTVQTNFSAIAVGQSDAATAIADEVACSGIDGGTLKTKYKVAVATNVIVGTVLVGGANLAEVVIGIHRQPNLKA